MAKDKNRMGRTPQDDAPLKRDRRNKGGADEGSPKAERDSENMNQKSDRDSEDRFTNDSDPGTPRGSRGGAYSTPDRHSQRIDDDEDDDMDFRPSRPAGSPRRR